MKSSRLQRLRDSLGAQVEGLDGEAVTSEAARRFWSERTVSELAAVPAFSQTALAMVREGYPTDALAAISAIVSDEVRHTELSRAVAELCGGYDESAEHGIVQPRELAGSWPAPLEFWLVGNGCISETVSLALLGARAKTATHPGIAEVLRSIAKDEAVHSATCWHLFEELAPRLSELERVRLGGYARELLAVVRITMCTSGLSPVERDQARRIRTETAERGLGAIPPDQADAIVETTVQDTIAPRLLRLGVRCG